MPSTKNQSRFLLAFALAGSVAVGSFPFLIDPIPAPGPEQQAKMKTEYIEQQVRNAVIADLEIRSGDLAADLQKNPIPLDHAFNYSVSGSVDPARFAANANRFVAEETSRIGLMSMKANAAAILGMIFLAGVGVAMYRYDEKERRQLALAP